MNVFVLCTGRSGSVTFSRAAAHIRNYTSGHETRVRLLGEARLDYPDNHIEIDNRLTWLLGRLEERFGQDAFYVHLTRNADETAASFNKRWKMRGSIITAYADAILMGADAAPLAVCADYVDTVDTNIRAFLKSKPHSMHFELESSQRHWRRFWEQIGAEGDLKASLDEWKKKYHRTPERSSLGRRAVQSAKRMLRSSFARRR